MPSLELRLEQIRDTEFCRYCGCSENNPCLIGDDLSVYRASDGEVILPGEDYDLLPCSWLIPGVCTAPSCVAKAYVEATLEANQLSFVSAARVA